MFRYLVVFLSGISITKAQVTTPADTLPIRMLSSITIQASQDADTLQQFLLANKAMTTEEMLTKLHGVSLIRRGSYGQEPIIHGMSGAQLNVTIDGMKMFGACTDKMDPVSIYIEPQNLQSIAVQTGAQGSRLGSTVGGSINMQLLEPQFSTTTFAGTMGIAYQAVSSGVNAFTMGNYSSVTSALNYSINYRKANNYEAGGGEDIAFTQFEKMNVTLSGKWKTEQGIWSAKVLADDGWNIGFAALPMDVGYAKARLAAIEYEHAQCHRLFSEWSAKLYYNSVQHSMDDSNRMDVLMHMDMPGESYTTGAFWEGKMQVVGKHVFNLRSDFFYNKVLAEMVMYPDNGKPMYMQTWPSSARSDLGFFVEDTYIINKRNKVKVSVRWDATGNFLHKGFGFDQALVFGSVQESSFQQAKSFAAGLRKQLNSKIVVDWNVAFSDRLPSLSELYGFYLFNRNDGYDYIGNSNLETEKSVSSDLVLSFFSKYMEMNISSFYKYLSDYIYPYNLTEFIAMTPGANGVRMYKNSASAVMMGLDFSILASLSKRIQVFSTLKSIRGMNEEKKALPSTPPFSANLILKYSILKQISIQAECDAAMQQNRYNNEFGEDATPAFAVYAIRLQREVRSHGLLVACGIENILDKHYHAHLDWGNIPRPGRNFYLNFSHRF